MPLKLMGPPVMIVMVADGEPGDISRGSSDDG